MSVMPQLCHYEEIFLLTQSHHVELSFQIPSSESRKRHLFWTFLCSGSELLYPLKASLNTFALSFFPSLFRGDSPYHISRTFSTATQWKIQVHSLRNPLPDFCSPIFGSDAALIERSFWQKCGKKKSEAGKDGRSRNEKKEKEKESKEKAAQTTMRWQKNREVDDLG